MRAKVASHKKQHDVLVGKIHQLMEINGEAGLVAKICMLAGLTESEACYCYNQDICDNSCCNCHKLHIINKRNGMTVVVINWARDHGRRIYFALMPSLLWERFRELTSFNESDIIAADKVVKQSAGMELSCVCKQALLYGREKTMNEEEIDILSGKATPAAAKCCLLFGIDELVRCYVDGWERVGVILPVL